MAILVVFFIWLILNMASVIGESISDLSSLPALIRFPSRFMLWLNHLHVCKYIILLNSTIIYYSLRLKG